MNKAELIEAIASKVDLPKTVAGKTLDAVLETICESLQKGDIVSLVGFGTFLVRKRAARTGRNPKTGEKLEIPEAMVPTFKPGKFLKKSVEKVTQTEEIME